MRARSCRLFALCLTLVLCAAWSPAQPQQEPVASAAPTALQWEPLSAGLDSPFSLWFHPDYASNRTIWASQDYTLQDVGYGYGTLYRSTDGGMTWTARSPLGHRIVLAAFARTGVGDPTIFALEAAVDTSAKPVYHLLRSTTGGASFQTV